MCDYLLEFQDYKDIKEICDIIQEILELRFYYSNQQYDKMLWHIQELTIKYSSETRKWNSIHTEMPTNFIQSYINAEMFLRNKGMEILFTKGVKAVKSKITDSEVRYILQLANGAQDNSSSL